MTSQKLWTAAQLAEVLGLNPKVVARHTRAGRYAAFAVNLAPAGAKPIWRYHPGRYAKWLESRATSAA